jgi:SagB-type dehydrogenase family enzyme
VAIDRRGFFRAGAASLALLLGQRAGATTDETALGIHRATRNTWQGAIGARLRAYRRPPGRFKAYPGQPRLALPAARFEAGRPIFAALKDCVGAPGFEGTGLTPEELARLLFLTNGVTDRSGRIALRAAPSAGALYAGEVYIVIERARGLAAGVYAYHAGHHDLVRLREGSFLSEVGRSLEQPHAVAGTAAAVLLTNVFDRYTVRYANRGYRYAVIDSGHIGENLRLAAWELGFAERMPTRFEDHRLNELLRVDGRGEAVCAVHLLGRPGLQQVVAPAAAVPRLVERQTQSALPAGLAAPLRYHEATKLVATGEAVAAEPSQEGSEGMPSALEQQTIPSVDTPVHTAIRRRRSATHFETAAIPRHALLEILALARGQTNLHRSRSLDVYCVANRVTETQSGLYRYDPAARNLVSQRRADLAAPLIRACLGQEKSGQAAVALIGVARLAEASARGGARAYRDLLLDAGATAQRLYLGAEALGFAARNLAAFYDDDLDTLLGLDGEREVAVHLTALGPGT